MALPFYRILERDKEKVGTTKKLFGFDDICEVPTIKLWSNLSMEFNSLDLVRLKDEDGTPYACFTLAKGHDHYPKK